MPGSDRSILLTVDVEDWFQVENFKGCIPFSSWASRDLRVESNTHKILDLLDEFPFKPRATFFVLGWIARKVPWLVREIRDRGHEIASHGINHHLCTSQAPDELIRELEASRFLLEDISGSLVSGYRAPSFAIDHGILNHIRAAGYGYDSSYNSFAMHGRYGQLNLDAAGKTGAAFRVDDRFFELPLSNLSVGHKVLPLGGGGYFRLIPFNLFRLGMNQVLDRDGAFVFYSHPWEFDPDQPRVSQAPPGFKFRHYINLKTTYGKLQRLIRDFGDLNFMTCAGYLEALKGASFHESLQGADPR